MPIEIAAEVQRSGLIRNNDELASHGIAPCTVEAIPHYLAWTRTDLALSVAILGLIANDARSLAKQAKLIAIAVWVIVALMIYAIFIK